MKLGEHLTHIVKIKRVHCTFMVHTVVIICCIQ